MALYHDKVPDLNFCPASLHLQGWQKGSVVQDGSSDLGTLSCNSNTMWQVQKEVKPVVPGIENCVAIACNMSALILFASVTDFLADSNLFFVLLLLWNLLFTSNKNYFYPFKVLMTYWGMNEYEVDDMVRFFKIFTKAMRYRS